MKRLYTKMLFLAVAIASLGVFAGSAAATTGNATTLAPAGHNFALALVAATNATLTTSNGAGTTISCATSTGAGSVPAATNNASSGSVTSQLSTAVGFSNCAVTALGTPTVTESGVEYLDAQNFTPAGDSNDVDVIGLGVNQNGYDITFSGSATCHIKASPNGASAILGAFTDGTNSTTAPSKADVDEQVDLSFTGCPVLGTAPGIEIAHYTVKDTTNTANAITF